MTFRAAWLFAAVLCLTGCSDSDDSRACSPVDPVQINLGGNRYAIPASYQPHFKHGDGRDKTFHVFSQNYYQDGKRLKYRYCKRDGHQDVDGIGFYLESETSRKNDGYDTRDAIVSRNAPRFPGLQHVTMIAIDNIPSSNEWMKEGQFVEGMTLSEDGQYYYRDRYEHPNGICERQLISVNPSIFGGKISASCTSPTINPNTVFWRLYIGADALGKPNGSIKIDINGKSFADWDPILQDVKSFIDSMREQGR
jgi:hypothetical protein